MLNQTPVRSNLLSAAATALNASGLLVLPYSGHSPGTLLRQQAIYHATKIAGLIGLVEKSDVFVSAE